MTERLDLTDLVSFLPPLEGAMREHGEVVIPHLVVREHQDPPPRVHRRVQPVPVVVVLRCAGLYYLGLFPTVVLFAAIFCHVPGKKNGVSFYSRVLLLPLQVTD